MTMTTIAIIVSVTAILINCFTWYRQYETRKLLREIKEIRKRQCQPDPAVSKS